ncbi:MAG: copper-binding protein [Nitrosopumilaceae archaeon]|nr:copper-binding protein [Nitrosopumilaceae archaeon]NIU00823.1 copper-binding protein [Nitrosopumilaceae archaeon]NIU87276.1 copper-binding protein [Nitrosopumilaceae archaeon]NIV65804.1 copper-binding protein [Nitrosopumilaceae archaeon]NIX61425.1 copper-binding protein [Nitrosopumilaceae archaeon]
MPLEQALFTWVHLVSASIWVGGSIFLGIVLSPLLRTMYDSVEKRLQIMIKVGRRFNKIAVPSLIILIITGIYNSTFFFSDPQTMITTNYGSFLLIKIILVIALIITYIIHVRIIRKDVEERIMTNQASQKQIQALRKKIIILGEVTVVLSVAILFFAAMLDAGV